MFVNPQFGDGGDVCSAAFPEYVRFYISFDNGDRAIVGLRDQLAGR